MMSRGMQISFAIYDNAVPSSCTLCSIALQYHKSEARAQLPHTPHATRYITWGCKQHYRSRDIQMRGCICQLQSPVCLVSIQYACAGFQWLPQVRMEVLECKDVEVSSSNGAVFGREKNKQKKQENSKMEIRGNDGIIKKGIMQWIRSFSRCLSLLPLWRVTPL